MHSVNTCISSQVVETFPIRESEKNLENGGETISLEFSKCFEVETFPLRKCVKYIENGGKKVSLELSNCSY